MKKQSNGLMGCKGDFKENKTIAFRRPKPLGFNLKNVFYPNQFVIRRTGKKVSS